MRKTRKQRMAEMRQPPPPLEHTLAELNTLATKAYETKARTRNAIKLSHIALVEVLQTLQSFSKHPDLVANGTVDTIHKQIRRALKLKNPEPPKLTLDEILRQADEAIASAEEAVNAAG